MSDIQAWHPGRPRRRPPSVNAWVDGGWLSVRGDSVILRAPLGDAQDAHVLTAQRYVNRHRDAVYVLNRLRDEIRDAAERAKRLPLFDEVACYLEDDGWILIEDAYWYESGSIAMTASEARLLAGRLLKLAAKAPN